jgi:RHS repeat-associated protein
MVYDSATYNSTAMSNAKGQLAEAYTGSSTSKTTDEFFSYSVRGELTDTWECTPHSGTNGCASVGNYYHVTASFWANGALNTLSSNITGVPTQTYGVDPMGRTASVSAGSGQNPVTSTSYNLSTFTYGVTFGSGDSDQFNLDPNTGRMTKYTFNMGTYSDAGQTAWNPNGSLASLQITDTIPNTTDTQTCSYTHDDLARIASVGCANGSTNKWNQNFTYDAFGNITKTTSGPGIAFQPTYSTASNWITALPGINTTTDNNGQMTYDGTHNYTWDAEGKMLSLDTITLTHDALGRMVENNVSGTYTQIVYGTAGNEFATMNGQTLVKAFIPLPAAIAVYTSTGLASYRHADHLGSSRLATTPSRTMSSSTAYAPYGEPYAQAGATDLSFTGQDQDTVSGTYDFLARKYNPVQGRWLSPDPAGLGAANPETPQSWNRYAYVQNNPMSLIDPLGLDCIYIYDNGTYYNTGGDCLSSSDDGIYVDGTVTSVGLWTDTGDVTINYTPDGGAAPGTLYGMSVSNAPINAAPASEGPGSANLTGPSGAGNYVPVGGGQSGGGPGSIPGQCSVAVSCHPTQTVQSRVHCGITANANGTSTRYDGGPAGSASGKSGQGMLTLLKINVQENAGTPPGDQIIFSSQVSCGTVSCIGLTAYEINSGNAPYSLLASPGPITSNTAAQAITSSCGLNVKYPSNAMGIRP